MQHRNESLSTLKIAVLLSLLCPALALGAAQVPPSAPVTVVNKSSNPVPIVGSVGLSGTANVQIINGGTNPVPVSISNSAPPEVVQVDYSKDLNDLLIGTGPELIYSVPAGFRLVIEYLEVQGSLQSGEAATGGIYTTVNSKTSLHETMTPPAPFLLNGTALTNQGTTAGKTVRIYADPGTDVMAQVDRSDGTGHAFIVVVINGYLQPLP